MTWFLLTVVFAAGMAMLAVVGVRALLDRLTMRSRADEQPWDSERGLW